MLSLRCFRIALALVFLSDGAFSILHASPAFDDISELRAQMAEQRAEINRQQAQIDELRRVIGEQARVLADMRGVSPTRDAPAEKTYAGPDAAALPASTDRLKRGCRTRLRGQGLR